jgi:hypothetical protein
VKFSKFYRTFEDWESAHEKSTSYNNRVARLHSLYPKATLDQLRGHSKLRTKVLSKETPILTYKLAWNALSSRERFVRERALEILSIARQSGQSLSKLSKEQHLPIKVVLKATNGFRKSKRRWKAKRFDRISRTMAINEHGREVYIEITDSRQASIIGSYQSAVGKYLATGDQIVLDEFKGVRVRDSEGKFHVLETNLQALKEIHARREEPEFYDIYKVSM